MIKILRQDIGGRSVGAEAVHARGPPRHPDQAPERRDPLRLLAVSTTAASMVWEHIQGEEVGDRVRRLGPFQVPVAIQLGIQALRGWR